MKAKLTHIVVLLNNIDNVRDFGTLDFRMQLADIAVSAKYEYDKYMLLNKESKDFKEYVEAKQRILQSCMDEPTQEQKKSGLKQSFNQDEFVKQISKLNKTYSVAVEKQEEENKRLQEESLNKEIELDVEPINKGNIDKDIPLNMLTIISPFIAKE